MGGRISGFSEVCGASACGWLWLALVAALALVACGGGGGGGSGQTGTVPPQDTQFAEPPPPRPTAVLGFSADPVEMEETGGWTTLTLQLDHPVPAGGSDLIFRYAIDTLDGPDSIQGEITIEAGSDTGMEAVYAMDDTRDEGFSEIMTIHLGALRLNSEGIRIPVHGIDPVEVIVIDDDGSTGIPPESVARFYAVPTRIDEDGGIPTLTLELNSRIPSGDPALTFRYVIDGATINAEDIPASDRPDITIGPGDIMGTAEITGLGDLAIEGDEIITVRLDALPNNASGNPITAAGIEPVQITITDDDVPVQPDRVAGFSAAPAQITEGGNGAILTLILNRPLPDGKPALRFPYIIGGDNISAADTTASDPTGFITVEPRSSIGTVSITALQDFTAEEDEAMTIRLGDLPDNASGGKITADGIDPVEIIIMDAPVMSVCNALLIGDPAPEEAPVSTDKIRQTITLSAGEAAVSGTLDDFDYHVYRITLARAGRLVITPESSLNLEAVLFRAPVLSGGNCPPSEDGYASDVDPDDNLNFSFDGDLEAGSYYLVVNDYLGDSGDYLLRLVFTPPDDVGGNAPTDAAGEQARLTRQVRALALSTMAAQTGMLTDLVRRRGRASPDMDGVRIGPLPDEGGSGDLRSLLKSSLSLQHSYRLDSGGYASAWMSSTATSLAGDPSALHAGLEWATPDRRAIHGLAISAGSSSLPFSANVAGLENTGPHRSPNRPPDQGPKQWPNQWNESMTLIAPYLTRRTDNADIWITAGIGGGEVRLEGSGADATIMFLQAGAAWKKIFPAGQQFDLEAQGRAARKHVSGFRLNAHDIPGLTLDLFQLDGRASLLWPLTLAGGIVRPGVKADFSHDFSDILPGRDRRRLRSVSAVSWTRGLFSAALESRQHSAGRKPPWRNLTARMKLDSGDGFTATLDSLVGGRGVQFTLKGVF